VFRSIHFSFEPAQPSVASKRLPRLHCTGTAPVRIIDCFPSFQNGRVFDFLVIELAKLILVLVTSPSGKIGITDFYLFENYDSAAPVSPQA
jgi:hypothetical protein